MLLLNRRFTSVNLHLAKKLHHRLFTDLLIWLCYLHLWYLVLLIPLFSLHEKWLYSQLFWSLFSVIRNRITPNTDTFHGVTMNYLTQNNILYRYKSRFRKNDSRDTFLSCFSDKILTGISSGLLTAITLINLQKVFDTINHHILLKKYLLFNVPII